MSPVSRVHPEGASTEKGEWLDSDSYIRQPPTSRLVELLIGCTDLQVETEKAHPNTLCVLSQRKFGQWKEYDRTEIVYHSSSPLYCHSFTLEHHRDAYGERLKFSVYVITKNSRALDDQQLIAEAEVGFSDLIDDAADIHSSSVALMASGHSKPRGHLRIVSEIIRPTRSKVIFNVGGSRLKRKGIIGNKKPHTVLEIGRSIDAVEYHPIYRTPVCWETSEPRWKPFEISFERLCNSDKKRNIRFSVAHVTKEGSIPIGELETSLAKLQTVANGKNRALTLQKSLLNTKKDSMKEKGIIKIYDLIVEHNYTFLDYARGGCVCNLFVGIDFTLSNGSYETDESFHGINENNNNRNIYQSAIESVLQMFSPYIRDSHISAFGFGAKLSNSNEVNHCFPLSLSGAEIKSSEDLLQQYIKTLPTLKFAGPTYLTPLLRRVMEETKKQKVSQQDQQYFFLLIFTDGVLNDLEEFKQQLNEIRDLPLSVLIIGVGPMDLSALECFDSREEDTAVLSKSKISENCRQNAHFFHLRSRSAGGKKMIAEGFTTLASQLVSYMRQTSITPNEPVIKQMNGTARIYEIGELRASIKRRQASMTKVLPCPSSPTTCPTCGHVIEESTDL